MSHTSPENLEELLTVKLQSLYYTEQQLTKALPKMAEAATDPDLKKAFEEHLTETQNQMQRLEQAFQEMDQTAEAMENDAINGLIADGEWIAKNIQHPQTKDAALIAAAQYVEHYEMAGYGSASAWAEQLGYEGVVELLDMNQAEEEMADEKLNGLAMAKINEGAEEVIVEESTTEETGILGKMQPGGAI